MHVYLVDPAAMFALRSALSAELGTGPVTRLLDTEVVKQVAVRLASRKLLLTRDVPVRAAPSTLPRRDEPAAAADPAGGWELTELSYPARIAPGAEAEDLGICWTITGTGARRPTAGTLELFRTKQAITGEDGDADRGEPTDKIWSYALSAAEADIGRTEFPWVGEIGSHQDFPLQYVSAEFSPYKLKLTASERGAKSASLEAVFRVTVDSLQLELGAATDLSSPAVTPREQEVLDALPSLPAAGRQQKLSLPGDCFTVQEDGDASASSREYQKLWDPLRIPLHATVWFLSSKGARTRAPKAWGRWKLQWDWKPADPPVDPSAAIVDESGKAQQYMEWAQGQCDAVAPGGNCPAALGGKSGKHPVFARPAGGTGSFSAGKHRTWAAMTAPADGGEAARDVSVWFAPSHLPGDSYQLALRLGSAGVLDTPAEPAPGVLSTRTGTLVIWRRLRVVRYFRRGDGPSIDFDAVQKQLDPAFVELAGKDTSIAPLDEAAYKKAMQGAYDQVLGDLAGSAWAIRRAMNRDTCTDDTGGRATRVQPYHEFSTATLDAPAFDPAAWETLVASARKREPGLFVAGSGVDDEVTDDERAYGVFCISIVALMLRIACARLRPDDHGITVVQFPGLNVASDRLGRRALKGNGALLPATTPEDRGRGLLLMFSEPKDMYKEHSMAHSVAHEVGHLLFLSHAPFPEDAPPTGAEASEHDPADPNCTMGYNPPGAPPKHFCGVCLLRLRGWDQEVVVKAHKAHRKA